jgi:N-acetylglutamate synthase-like GNAT family acetyltransferase
MIIRRCTAADVDAIDEIINDAAVAYRGVIADDRWHEPYMSREELEREISAGVVFWAAVDDEGTVLGVMGLQDVKDVTLIRHAYTRTRAQGRGVGAALLERLVGQTTRPVLIGTWRAATWAIRFYERHGFRLVDENVEKVRLLKTYWTVPDRQIDESVVLRQQMT